MADQPPFWRVKTLEQMSRSEWESLCDGCGRCCLVKLEEELEGEDSRIHYTEIGCALFDARACRCQDYANRQKKVSDCVKLTPEAVRTIRWLPPTCGYRLVAEGRDLKWWHPLVSGDPETVHQAGVSARGKVAVNEVDIPEEASVDFIVTWPAKWPKGAKGARPKTRK
ncbi:MAG: YcgN family cysteine cluster protein [Rhodoblastus sp.]|nr:MAG: YcgN family cysteine cluster protein [Rhodoblastus sp.]